MPSGDPPSSISRYPFPPDTAHFKDPRVGRAWYATGAGALIVQTTVTQATPLGARILCDWVDTALNRERQTLEQLGGLFIFHDWRSISRTREQMIERMRACPRGYARRTTLRVRTVTHSNLFQDIKLDHVLHCAPEPIIKL